MAPRPPSRDLAAAAIVYKDVIHDQTSCGTQEQGHVLEQLLGGVAHEW